MEGIPMPVPMTDTGSPLSAGNRTVSNVVEENGVFKNFPLNISLEVIGKENFLGDVPRPALL